MELVSLVATHHSAPLSDKSAPTAHVRPVKLIASAEAVGAYVSLVSASKAVFRAPVAQERYATRAAVDGARTMESAPAATKSVY